MNSFPVKIFQDSRGLLGVIESVIPFEIKRVFWIVAPQGSIRGAHGHFSNEMVLILISGEVDVRLVERDGATTVTALKPSEGFYIAPHVWHQLLFAHDSTVLALNSCTYDPEDYFE